MAKLSWRALNAKIADMDEQEVQHLLDHEITFHQRPMIAKRLHQRLCAMRMVRERADIMQRIGA